MPIESEHHRKPQTGVRLRARRVCRWRYGKKVVRWAVAASLITEQSFRRILDVPRSVDVEKRLSEKFGGASKSRWRRMTAPSLISKRSQRDIRMRARSVKRIIHGRELVHSLGWRCRRCPERGVAILSKIRADRAYREAPSGCPVECQFPIAER